MLLLRVLAMVTARYAFYQVDDVGTTRGMLSNLRDESEPVSLSP
jgi:hypothetical protein